MKKMILMAFVWRFQKKCNYYKNGNAIFFKCSDNFPFTKKVDIKIGHKQATLFSYLRMCHLYPDQRER